MLLEKHGRKCRNMAGTPQPIGNEFSAAAKEAG
jgi:hypothetical protein